MAAWATTHASPIRAAASARTTARGHLACRPIRLVAATTQILNGSGPTVTDREIRRSASRKVPVVGIWADQGGTSVLDERLGGGPLGGVERQGSGMTSTQGEVP